MNAVSGDWIAGGLVDTFLEAVHWVVTLFIYGALIRISADLIQQSATDRIRALKVARNRLSTLVIADYDSFYRLFC